MNQQMGATIVMVTHDAFTASYTERILFLRDAPSSPSFAGGTTAENSSLKKFWMCSP